MFGEFEIDVLIGVGHGSDYILPCIHIFVVIGILLLFNNDCCKSFYFVGDAI